MSTKTPLALSLRTLGVYEEIAEWVNMHPRWSMRDAWNACERADWLMQMAGHLGVAQGRTHATVTHILKEAIEHAEANPAPAAQWAEVEALRDPLPMLVDPLARPRTAENVLPALRTLLDWHTSSEGMRVVACLNEELRSYSCVVGDGFWQHTDREAATIAYACSWPYPAVNRNSNRERLAYFAHVVRFYIPAENIRDPLEKP
jgi:hypothetical protein